MQIEEKVTMSKKELKRSDIILMTVREKMRLRNIKMKEEANRYSGKRKER